MTARAEKEALEAAGFVRLPTLWVYPEEAARIYQIAKPHKDIVQSIKKQVRKNNARNNQDRALRDQGEHSLRQEREATGETG